jgi:hypothetical protein
LVGKYEQNVAVDDVSMRSAGVFVSKRFFDLMEIDPMMGRYFEDAQYIVNTDDLSANQFNIVLAESFWKNQMGGDRDILGKIIYVDSLPNTVIGVAPSEVGSLVGNPDFYGAFAHPYGLTDQQRLDGRFRLFAHLWR